MTYMFYYIGTFVSAGAFLFSTVTVLAAALFAFTSMSPLRGTPWMFPLLMTARVLFGTAGGTVRSKFPIGFYHAT